MFFNFPTVHFFKMKYFIFAVFWIARMLWWFLYFNMDLKTGYLKYKVTESFASKFWTSAFYTIYEKKLMSFLHHIQSQRLFIFSQFCFLLEYCLVKEKKFYCFSKFRIIHSIFLIQILVILFFCLFQEGYAFILVLHRTYRFLLFTFLKSFTLNLDLFIFLWKILSLWTASNWL